MALTAPFPQAENRYPKRQKRPLLGLVEAARQVGAEIPESISEMLESGNVEGATAALAGSIQGKLEGLAQIASESGLEIPAELAAAIESRGYWGYYGGV